MPAPESQPPNTPLSALDRAVELMRADVPVRNDWRDGLLRQIAAEPTPASVLPSAYMPEVQGRTSPFMRSFVVHPVAAIAACLLAMLAGVAGTIAYMHSNTAPALVAAAASPAPMVPVANAALNAPATGAQKVIRFALVAPNASHVSIVGDFNNWNASATPLRTSQDGNTWMIDLPLSAGRHVYAFVVDGDLVADPSAPRVVDHDFGVQNSVVLVGSL